MPLLQNQTPFGAYCSGLQRKPTKTTTGIRQAQLIGWRVTDGGVAAMRAKPGGIPYRQTRPTGATGLVIEGGGVDRTPWLAPPPPQKGLN